jgi:hypothetical protein
MKTMKSILIVTAVSATLFSVNAAEPLFSPRASGIRHPVIASTGVKDPNLIAGPRLGKNTPNVVVVTASGVKDPDLLAAVKNCSMTPKTKDTPACAKHCEVAGIK